MSFNICQHFAQYFSLSIANNSKLLQEVHKIRYEVYCQELNYEPPENFPNGMERDIYDSHAVHCLLRHKSTGIYAGCVRIILPQKDKIGTSFPWQKFASSLVYPHGEHQQAKLCEISRLAVRSQFRRRKEDRVFPLGGVFPDLAGGNRRFPLIAMSLYWAAFCLALNLKLDIYAVMEPRLARHLRRCGLRYCMVSNLFEFHGTRGIFFTRPPELLEYLDANTYEFFYFLHNIIAKDLIQGQYISTPYPVKKPPSTNDLAIVQ